MDFKKSQPGAIALVGSGEYTSAMAETDRLLLETVGGPSAARVVIMATASGLEDPSSPARWTALGMEHFKGLGADVNPASILKREDAAEAQWLELLEEANFYYFSGGNPQHLIETIQETPAWQIIRRKWEGGAVLAGCSAGAMALGGFTIGLRAVMLGKPPAWVPALGLLPNLITIPHFDRFGGFAGNDMLPKLAAAIPENMVMVGVDEDTALVRTGNGGPVGPDEGTNWLVSGRQGASVIGRDGTISTYPAGKLVSLKVA